MFQEMRVPFANHLSIKSHKLSINWTKYYGGGGGGVESSEAFHYISLYFLAVGL